MVRSNCKELSDDTNRFITAKILPLIHEAVMTIGMDFNEKNNRALFLLTVLHVNDNKILFELHKSGDLAIIIQILNLWLNKDFIKLALDLLAKELTDSTNKKQFFIDFARKQNLFKTDSEGKIIVNLVQSMGITTLHVPCTLPYATGILESEVYLSFVRSGLIPIEWDWCNFGHGRYAHWIQLYILFQALEYKEIILTNNNQNSHLKSLLNIISSTKSLKRDLKESSLWDLLMDNYFFYIFDLLSNVNKILLSSSKEDNKICIILKNYGIHILVDLFFSHDTFIQNFHSKLNLFMLKHMPNLAKKILISPVRHDLRIKKDWNDALTSPSVTKLILNIIYNNYSKEWGNSKIFTNPQSILCISQSKNNQNCKDSQTTVNNTLTRLGIFYYNDLILFKTKSVKSSVSRIYINQELPHTDEVVTGDIQSGETAYPCYKR